MASRTFDAANSFINSAADAYAEYKFFAPTDESILAVALKAQEALAAYYGFGSVPLKNAPANFKPVKPRTLVEALEAMHNIEHQCSHAGLKALITKSVQDSIVSVDDGAIVTAKKP